MLDLYEELSPENLIKRAVGQICSPGLLGNTSVKGFERLDLFRVQDDLEVMAISSLEQEDPSIWLMLVMLPMTERVIILSPS